MLLKKIICVFSVLLIFFCNNVFAATKEDVISAINKTYTVGKETYRLPQKIITKGENYLNKNKLSSAQYDNILRCIDNAVALAREVGTTDIKKVSKEDLNRALQILTEASASANLDLNEELAENDISISEIVNPPPVVEPEIPELPVVDEPVNAETNTGNEQPTINNVEKNEDKNKPNNVGQTSNNQANNDQISNNQTADKTQTNIDINNSNETVPDKIPTENNTNVPTVGNTQNSTQNVNKQGDINIEKLLTIAIAVLIFILFVFILIFYLLFKSNWNKILKYMLMIIFVILIIFVLVVLVGLFYYMEEIKLVYKLYYMFN